MRHPKLLVTLAVWSSSFSAIFARLSGEMPPLAIAFFRLSFSVPIFLSVMLINRTFREELLHLKLPYLGISAAAGFLLALHFITWFSAVARTSIINATVLCAMHPVFIILLSITVLKEQVSWQMIVSLLLSMIGATVMAGIDFASPTHSNLIGDGLALLSAFFLSCYWILGRVARKILSAGVYIPLAFFSCWGCLFFGMLITKTPFLGYSSSSYFWVFLMALVCQLIAHAGMNWGLAYVSPMFISALDNTSAIITAVLGFLIFQERPGIWQLLGGIVAISGLLLYNFHDSHRMQILNKGG